MADKKLGWVSEKFESGGRGPGTVSGGVGDAGGQSYGAHQLSSKAGTLAAYLRQSTAFGAEFSGLIPATSAFNYRWKSVAAAQPDAFAADQDAYITRTHYAPQVAIARGIGLNVDTHGSGIREALYSIGVQYGPNSQLVVKALAGKTLSAMTDAQIINAIYDYKAANVATNFRSSSAAVQAAVKKRIESERQVVLGIKDAILVAQPAPTPVPAPVVSPPPVPQVQVAYSGESAQASKSPLQTVFDILGMIFKKR